MQNQKTKLQNLLKKAPKTWNEITVEQFQELHEVDKMESSSMFDKDLERISILCDVDVYDLESFTASQIIQFKPLLEFVYKQPKNTISEHLKFDKLELKYIGFDSLNLAEFIDLDTFYCNDIIDNLHLVAGILYRQERIDNWKTPIKEPYNFDPETRGHLFKNIPVTEIVGIIDSFRKFHSKFLEDYEGLFPEPDELPEPEEEETLEERKERQKRIKEEEQQQKWGWERLIFELSGGDITKIDEVLETNLILTFNQLSMKREMKLD
jgi:hypothetical protein